MNSTLLASLTLAAFVLPTALSAQTPAVTSTSTGSNVSYRDITDVVFGFEFTPNSSFDITHLGMWDHQANGIAATYPMGLFDAAGNTLGATQIDAGTGNQLLDRFRYAPLANPVTVQAGQSYRVACYQAAGQPKERFLASSQVGTQASFDDAFTYTGSFTQFDTNGLVAPTSSTTLGWRIGPTFLFREGRPAPAVTSPSTASGVSYRDITDVVFGFQFTPGFEFEITHLGMWDYLADGMVATYPMGLFDDAGNQLGAAQIEAGTVNPIVDRFRYARLTAPVTVEAGRSYRVACYQAAGQAKERFLSASQGGVRVSFSRAFAFDGSFTQFNTNGLVAPTSSTTATWRVGPTFLMDVQGAEVSRVGSPANPDVFLPGVSGPPRLGGTWDPVVDHTTFLPGATMDVALIAFAPDNVPFSLGTVLCDFADPALQLTTPAGTPFSLAIPNNDGFVGLSLCVQALALDGANAALTNALDITIGTR